MISFIYTKATGEVSDRVAIVISEPKPNYLMIDVTSADTNADALVQANKAAAEYHKAMRTALDNLYEAMPNRTGLRSFKPENISELTEIEL